MPRTVGVEEEFLVFAASRAQLIGVGGQVAELVDRGSDGQFEHELKREQAELGSAPHRDLVELGAELRRRRAELARGAAERDARIVAAATSPVDGAPTATPNERYARMRDVYGEITRAALSCGMHVHVGVESRAEGVRVLDGIRGWLPLVLALSANSPFQGGRDTGYESFRSVAWQQWPTAGAFGTFTDDAHYDATLRALIGTGAALDDGMLYFDARLSAKYPTVEIRAADVCPRVDDATVIAGLCRALVDAAAADVLPVPDGVHARAEVLRGATWRAARFGMTDTLWHPVAAQLVPAWDLVDALLDELPDADALRSGLDAIRGHGTGSVLQRAVHDETDDLSAVVDQLAEVTLAH